MNESETGSGSGSGSEAEVVVQNFRLRCNGERG